MLRPGGLALLRVHLATAPRFATAAEVFAWHRGRPAGGPIFSRTRTDLDMLWLEPGSLRLSFAQYHRRIRELFEHGAITQPELDAYEPMAAVNQIQLFYTTREVFEAAALRHFEVEFVRTGDDYYGSLNHPIYGLRKEAHER